MLSDSILDGFEWASYIYVGDSPCQVRPLAGLTVGERSISCMRLGDSNRGKAFNLVNPSRDLVLNIALNEGDCTNSCSKMPFLFCTDGHASPLKECHCFVEIAVLDYEPGLGGIGYNSHNQGQFRRCDPTKS